MKTEESLRNKTAKGLLWGGLSNSVMQLLNLAFGIILARLLTPSDYGMVGMLTVFSALATALQESGFTSALINQQETRHEDLNAVFWFNVGMSVMLYIILFFSAPLIADFFHQPELTALARYTFIGFVISSTGICHNALLMKQLHVKENSIIWIIALIVSGTVGVLLAWQGFSYWGIATQTLLFILCTVTGRWIISGWHPTFQFDFKPLRSMFGFSVKILASNLITQVNNNILSVLLGRFFTEREVGYFNQGNKWNQMGYNTIQGMINGVAQPVLREVQNDRERLLRVFRKMLRFAAFVSMPCMFGLALTAPELITIAVTDKWAASAHIMQIICIGGAFLPLQNLMYNLLLSKGKSDVCMWNALAFGAVQIGTELFCVNHGITVMVEAFVVINVAWLFVWWYFARIQTGITLWQMLKDVLPFTAIAACSILVANYASTLVNNIYLSLAVKIVVAFVIYLGLMYLSGAQTFRDCLNYLLHKK